DELIHMPSRAARPATAQAPAGAVATADEAAASFADWMGGVLRREGMTMEAAARQLGVSVKTVSRWVGGTTEPRLRDLRRIRELFGDFPLP
ncbi:MAG TPA: helix-turn-helix transcriptional regulator, partial [Streptosporangiaceae bacterium]|nr:helix-turn-helix transcriptional regulator [Streptosporangiaceae bacterium]